MQATPGSNNGGPPAPATMQDEKADQHEQAPEEREAYQYWGYLFKADKTGTDKLKSLLGGLKEHMNAKYETSDNPDLTPNQLAHFYRELHGNYDQLFLGTPSESIAFIYKSLGCLHSLQPPPYSAFTDPTIPALKTEGWIMWQTIQLLLGPEEHSSFLMEAVQKWDVKDPATGEILPKIIPRRCFPMEPDKHMADWYEGVSERLRREAEDEERQRQIEAQQAEVRRLHDRKRDETDDEDSVDSRGPALAYFRNPLYQNIDGRPTIVRRNSKRPQLSPRRSSKIDKGKGAATTVGHVIRNIGSPHLWDGRTPSKSDSLERDRDRRRRSLPDNRYQYPGEQTHGAGHESMSPEHHHRRRSRPPELPAADSPERGDTAPMHSPRRHQQLREDEDPALRHSRSHEPTPSQKEYPDYFHGYDDPSNRRSSAEEESNAPLAPNGFGPSFGPSASPLFASHIAKQPQPQQQTRPPPNDRYGGPPSKSPSMRRSQDRPYSRSPDRSQRYHDRDDRHYGSRERRPDYDWPPRRGYDDGRSSAPPVGPPSGPGFPSPGGAPGDRPPPQGAPPYPQSGPLPSRDRRSGRHSGSDISYSGPEDRNGNRPRPKQTRFAAGVDGRKYPNENPWR